MSEPLLSVVIPTKDRARYAMHCLRTLTRLPDDDLEIIVQDNSATDDLGRTIADAGDARVRYEHRPGALSVIDNCELAMARARGTYVTLLGDDDGVSAALMNVTRRAAHDDLDALTPALAARYVWPDVRFKHYGGAYAGTLTVLPYTGRVRVRDAALGARRSLRAAFQDLATNLDLPKLYYGLVHRRAIEALRAEAGGVFPGVSPDMSAAVGLSKYARRFASLDFPVFLPGGSAVSTAGAHARKEHVGRLEDQPHLPRGCAASWPVEVPAVFAVQTVWAQSGLAALRATGRADLAREIDLGFLHAMTGTLNAGFWPVVRASYAAALRARGRSWLRGEADLASGVARTWAIRTRYLVGRLARRPWLVGDHQATGLAFIEDAAAALDAWIARRGPTEDEAAPRWLGNHQG
ncbi:MAG: glycosyltransferase [Candidatus Eisenbacteria bacterium]|nr:glycosyltransferase [Candidatus Eisenbacteria bacterium]